MRCPMINKHQIGTQNFTVPLHFKSHWFICWAFILIYRQKCSKSAQISGMLNSYKLSNPQSLQNRPLWPPGKTNCLPLCTLKVTLHCIRSASTSNYALIMTAHWTFTNSLYKNAVQYSYMLDTLHDRYVQNHSWHFLRYKYVPDILLLAYFYRYYLSACTALMSEWFSLLIFMFGIYKYLTPPCVFWEWTLYVKIRTLYRQAEETNTLTIILENSFNYFHYISLIHRRSVPKNSA
jgi:hypothetical protein